MKTRKFNFRTISALLLVGAVLGVAFISAALAAPGAAPSEKIQAAPMAALPEVTCSLVDTTRTCELWALEGDLTMPDGAVVPVWGFSDSISGTAQVPGPVIRANIGETVEIVVHNQIPGESIALAFPGLEWIPELEVVATDTVSATFSFDAQQSGAFLYEAGLTPGGARQVAMGLFGALVVGPPVEVFDQEEILIFSELDPAFNADPTNFFIQHYQPKYWLINGQAYPDTGTIDVNAGSTVLLRYLNAGVEHHAIGLLGIDQQIVAVDGETLIAPRGAVSEPLVPGETKDALVSVPLASPGTLYALYNASLHQHNNNQQMTDGRMAFGGMLTFLQVVAAPPPTGAGPVVSDVAVSPPRSDGTEDVTLTATLSYTNGIAAYEYYVDQPGTLTGTVIVSPTVTSILVTEIFSATQVDSLSHGEHVFYIRGQGSDYVWGVPGSAVLFVDKAGPVVSDVAVVPPKTNGTEDVTLSATLTDVDNVVAYEYYVDQPGTLTGTVIVSPTVASISVTEIFTATQVDSLSHGDHIFYILGQDSGGLWGAPGSAALFLDKAGPIINGMSLHPNPTNGSADVLLRATADDRGTGDSSVIAAEYRIDGGPWMTMTLSTTGSSITALTSTVLTDSLPTVDGEYPVDVRAQDEWFNWSVVNGSTLMSVDQTGPITPTVSLDPNVLDFNQPLPVTAVRLTATVEDADSTLANAQGFVGALGDPGTGFDLYPADGLFDESIEDVYYDIPASQFATLGEGVHDVWVVGIDQAGNWGVAGSASITVTAAVVDVDGPDISGLTITPDNRNRIILTGLAEDSQSTIARVDYSLDTDPNTSYSMSPSDGAFDSLIEAFEATIRTNRWAPSTIIEVVAMDASGNWGVPITIVYNLP